MVFNIWATKTISMDVITIKGIEVDAIIGVYEFERNKKQKLVIDIKMHYDSSQAVASDNIKYALDYHKVTTDIYEFISQSSFQLIETLTYAVADNILLNEAVHKIELTVWKPQALDMAENVGFSISKSS